MVAVKPIAAICHGPVDTGGGQRGARPAHDSWPSRRTDLHNAGAQVVDEEVVIDRPFTTSRSPADLPAFYPAIIEQFAKAPHAAAR